MSPSHYTVLAGGTGAAKFLRGLVRVVPEEQIHVVVNVADDTSVWGLHVSPDIDSVMYGLSGKLDAERGWGRRDETWKCLEGMKANGMPSWFRLGDRDLATHLTRTELLRSGLNLSDVVQRMAETLNVKARILPATGDPVRTKIETPGGVLGFQEFFVREQWKPEVRSVSYAGASEARAPEAVVDSIRAARLVIIAPSNPVTSIGPIIAIHDIRDALRCTPQELRSSHPCSARSSETPP